MSGISTKNLPLRQTVDEVIGNDSQDNTVRISRAALTRLVGNSLAEQITNAGGMAIFPTTAAGLSATTDGDYFSVPGAGDDYLILYRNDDGAAEEINRVLSIEGVGQALKSVETIYETQEAGESNTEDGSYFVVPTDDEYLILYRNDSGSAEEVQRYPSAKAVEATDQRVTDLAGSEELQAIRAQVDSDDWAVAWADPEGNVAAGFDDQGRFVGRIGQDVESYEVSANPTYVWGVADEAGSVALGVDTAGRSHLSGLVLPGAEAVVASTPNVAFAIADEQGRAAFVVYDDGTTSAGGGGDDPQPITHTVTWSFAEPIDDPSKELFVTWLTDSPDAKVLEYRPRGGQAWMAASSFRSRPFPELSGKWLHTVEMRGLSPDTIYDFRIPGSSYADAVKTCPALNEIRVVMASDWQNTDYSAASPLRITGDISTSQEPDILIFNGDFNNSDGRFTTAWATDYVNMFQVFHDHWRGPDGVMIPIVPIFGNHEGRNAAGTSNAHTGGDGTPGMIVDICSWTYSEFHDTAFARSVGTVRIRNLAAFVCLETDHTVPLMDQFEWYKEQLAEHCPAVGHSFIVGHVAPFNIYNGRYTDQACRDMRNHFWPAAEAYTQDSLRAWLSAHSHAMMVTPKLRVAYDEQAPAAENDNNFYRASDGFLNLGLGMVGGTPQPARDMDRLSNIDGKPFWEAAIANNGNGEYVTFGDVQNPMWPYYNIWVFDLTKTSWSARCLNFAGQPFYELTENTGDA